MNRKADDWYSPRESRPPFPVQRLLVGITGSVAATLVAPGLLWTRRVLGVDHLRVVMTRQATRFFNPEAAAAMSGNRVVVDWDDGEGTEALHIALAEWAEAFLIMPATANILAKAATGIADDLLSATILAADCPVIFAPDMNPAMWAKPATQRNVARLMADGYTIIQPSEEGLPITGERTGPGGMPNVPAVMSEVADVLARVAEAR